MKKIQFLISCLVLVLLAASPISYGQLYKWVDDQGNVHYGDSPPENADLRKIIGEVSSFTSISVEPFVYDPANVTQLIKNLA